MCIRTLDLMNMSTLNVSDDRKTLRLKEEDNIPDITVEISKNKYYLIKLPSDNLRNLILGQITKNCQSIDNYAENCAIDGVNLPNNGFYAFIKVKDKNFDVSNIDGDNFEKSGNKIVGQSYAYIGTDGALVPGQLHEIFR